MQRNVGIQKREFRNVRSVQGKEGGGLFLREVNVVPKLVSRLLCLVY